MVSILQLAAEKKTQFLVQLEIFWPFLFCDGFSRYHDLTRFFLFNFTSFFLTWKNLTSLIYNSAVINSTQKQIIFYPRSSHYNLTRFSLFNLNISNFTIFFTYFKCSKYVQKRQIVWRTKWVNAIGLSTDTPSPSSCQRTLIMFYKQNMIKKAS